MKNLLKRTTPILAVVAALSLGACMQSNAQTQTAQAPAPVMVGGQAMYPSKDIIDNAVNSADHKTLVAAVKAAGLVQTLKGKGPFTVFAPTDAAFNALPAGTVPTLLKPENKGKLTGVLTYHVVAGALTFDAIKAQIVAGGGKVVMKTVNGAALTASMNGPHNIVLTDAAGRTAHISTYDVIQSNGVIHVIDTVLLPG
ncbi:MAG: fasciclin domain-containing protein [Rhodospirillales bacterium]